MILLNSFEQQNGFSENESDEDKLHIPQSKLTNSTSGQKEKKEKRNITRNTWSASLANLFRTHLSRL